MYTRFMKATSRLCVALTLFLGVVFVGGLPDKAHASAEIQKQKEAYFNYPRAVKYWKEKQDFQDLNRDWLMLKDIYATWRKYYLSDPALAQQILERDPKAGQIKFAHDIYLLYTQWHKGYRSFDARFGWNDNGSGRTCANMKKANIFTASCRDYPDWRGPIELQKDTEELSQFKAVKN